MVGACAFISHATGRRSSSASVRDVWWCILHVLAEGVLRQPLLDLRCLVSNVGEVWLQGLRIAQRSVGAVGAVVGAVVGAPGNSVGAVGAVLMGII